MCVCVCVWENFAWGNEIGGGGGPDKTFTGRLCLVVVGSAPLLLVSVCVCVCVCFVFLLSEVFGA